MNVHAKPARRTRLMAAAAALVATGLAAQAASAQPAAAAPAAAANPIEADGTVNVPTFQLPPSIYLSDQAKASLPRKPTDMEGPMYQALASGKAGEMRARIGEFMAPTIKHHAELYPVTMTPTTIAGVPAVRVTPVKPIPAANKKKILLNLP